MDNEIDSHRWRAIEDTFEQLADLPKDQQAQRLAELEIQDKGLADEVASLLKYDVADDSLHEAERPPFSLMDSNEPLTLASIVEFDGTQATRTTGETVGHYQLLYPLAVSSNSEVWCANYATSKHHKSDELPRPERQANSAQLAQQSRERVAIKFLRASPNDQKRFNRFRNEVVFLSKFRHPSISELIDLGQDDQSPYFVMRLILGLPITEFCNQNQLTLADRAELMLQICDAVAYAHRYEVVHRDIKPSNLLVNSEKLATVLDFGISKYVGENTAEESGAVSKELTATQERPMTPAYASPEQVRGEGVSVLTDVYALGLVLYELLSGHHAYSLEAHPDTEKLFDRVCDSVPLPPSKVIRSTAWALESHRTNPSEGKTSNSIAADRGTELETLTDELQTHWDRLALKALAKSPGERFESVSDLRLAIHSALKPTLAHSITASPTWPKRFAVITGIATVVGAVAGVLFAAAFLPSSVPNRASNKSLQLSQGANQTFISAPGNTSQEPVLDAQPTETAANGSNSIPKLEAAVLQLISQANERTLLEKQNGLIKSLSTRGKLLVCAQSASQSKFRLARFALQASVTSSNFLQECDSLNEEKQLAFFKACLQLGRPIAALRPLGEDVFLEEPDKLQYLNSKTRPEDWQYVLTGLCMQAGWQSNAFLWSKVAVAENQSASRRIQHACISSRIGWRAGADEALTNLRTDPQSQKHQKSKIASTAIEDEQLRWVRALLDVENNSSAFEEWTNVADKNDFTSAQIQAAAIVETAKLDWRNEDWQSAIAKLNRVIELFKRLDCPDHILSLEARSALMQVHYERGDTEQASRVRDLTLPLLADTQEYGSIPALNIVARRLDLEHAPEVIDPLLKSLTPFRRVLQDNPHLRHAILIASYRSGIAQRNWAESLKSLDSLSSIQQTQTSEDPLALLVTQTARAYVLTKLDRVAEGAEQLQSAKQDLARLKAECEREPVLSYLSMAMDASLDDSIEAKLPHEWIDLYMIYRWNSAKDQWDMINHVARVVAEKSEEQAQRLLKEASGQKSKS